MGKGVARGEGARFLSEGGLLLNEDKEKWSAELKRPFRALGFAVNRDSMKKMGIGLLEYLWGMDIFINGIPFLKSILLANMLIWVVFLVVK